MDVGHVSSAQAPSAPWTLHRQQTVKEGLEHLAIHARGFQIPSIVSGFSGVTRLDSRCAERAPCRNDDLSSTGERLPVNPFAAQVEVVVSWKT